MKAFLEERKDILNYCFFFPYVPHVHRSVQKRKSQFLIACGIQHQKYLFIRSSGCFWEGSEKELLW